MLFTFHRPNGQLLGAVAVPALLAKNHEAATFLALAATQFRDVRKIERETLSSWEPLELIPRGNAYIEGIARVSFEACKYLAGGTALFTSIVCLGLSRYWPRAQPSSAEQRGLLGYVVSK